MNSVVLRRVLAPAIAVALGSTLAAAPATAATPDSSLQATEAAALNATMKQTSAVKTNVRTPAGSRHLGRAMLKHRKYSNAQFNCLDRLWMKESRWNYKAQNRRSGAYGIPQALPGRKMASAGKDWRTNPATQIKWGLGYIQDRYGSPCKAWNHSKRKGWY